jgi:2-iminobutanoate/2-iminopropanoate deaminase
MVKAMIGTALAVLMAVPALASEGEVVKRIGDPAALFSSAVWAGNTLYVSGILADPDVPADKAKNSPPMWTSDTKTQSINILQKIDKALKAQGLSLGDCVQLEAFLGGDPKLGNEMDFAGWNEAYKQFFGTADQPNKPVARHRAGRQAGGAGRSDRDHGGGGQAGEVIT